MNFIYSCLLLLLTKKYFSVQAKFISYHHNVKSAIQAMFSQVAEHMSSVDYENNEKFAMYGELRDEKERKNEVCQELRNKLTHNPFAAKM